MRHARWSEVDARGVLESWRRSGLSLERFAKQRGFVAQRLRWWKRLRSSPMKRLRNRQLRVARRSSARPVEGRLGAAHPPRDAPS